MYKRFLKRFFDLMVSIVMMPFFLLLLIPVSLLIKLEDGGPVFYNSERLGRKANPFKMYKFRSMVVNAPDLRMQDGSTFNAKNDPRVTRTGKFLRETSLDEIPQLINVFLGHMSLIGPRPDIHIYENLKDRVMKNLAVRPGLTGYSQAYFRSEISWEEKIHQDAYYVDHLTLMLDLKVLFRTIYTVIKREKTYRKTTSNSPL